MDFDEISIDWIMHDCFKIKAGVVIYTDPFQIPDSLEKADYILISHNHFDHCSLEDISKIATKNTSIITVKTCEKKLDDLNVKEIIFINQSDFLDLDSFSIDTLPAYNTHHFRSPGIPFHPKESGFVSFIINLSNKRIYFAGDIDKTPEMNDIKEIDIALLPVSGTYVMGVDEAVDVVKIIKPKIAIPMHIGTDIVGTKAQAKEFKKKASKFCKVHIL